VKISIVGKLKCILGKQKAGVNLAKKHKGMKQYECNKK
jgi:hypothetical protein